MERIERCEVCILGAGIAGLNALFAASRHLSRDQRVVLIDRNPRAGGMWLHTYDYVRLHQPHRLFTAGNIAWRLDRKPEHLATKDEVLDHFQHCLDVLKKRVTLREFYEYEYESHRELKGDDGVEVQVSCSPVSPEAPPLTVHANVLVKAYGALVPTNDPLSLSSANVVSTSPDHHDLLGEEMRASDAPVYIVGGGKTGMDTAHALITRFPDRKVNVVAGSGTVFENRNELFPTGLKRWWGGSSPTLAFMDIASRFDGTNEEQVHAYFHSAYGTSLSPHSRNFLFGALSEEENERVAANADQIIMEHLSDVVDSGDATQMVFRSGRRQTIERGSWVVNCTGYLFKSDPPNEPCVSELGGVLSIQLRSIIHVLSSFDAYFLVHLWFLERIGRIPLYVLDAHALHERSARALPYAALALSIHNFGQFATAVPRWVMSECGLDFERWYPFPRRLLTLMRFMWRRKELIDHCQRTLDTVRERFGVRCGPLQTQGYAAGGFSPAPRPRT